MTSMTIGRGGEVTLPLDVQERYGLKPETPVRLVETSTGILLIPLTNEPMSEDLLLGLFSDEPDLMDAVVEDAMITREQHFLRQANG